ncbi:MAG: aldo/keto reductase [Chloroflexi bacterium]|nr:aldo/keto reductase [Chloroflexota bacterium]
METAAAHTATAGEAGIPLGGTPLGINPLGVGTWAWGDCFFWGYGQDYVDADLQAAFETSLAAGVTLFDTAEVYGKGQSERLLGRFTHARQLGGAGEATNPSPIIATKFFPYPWHLRRGSLLRALRGSLDRLGVTQVDLYQIHWAYPPVPVEAWANALADAVEAGLTKAVGVSNYSADQMRRTHAVLTRRGIPLASNQVHYSLAHRRPERDGVLAACRELDVTLIAYSPLAMGLLTGKYGPEQPPPGLRGRRFRGRRLAQLQPLIATLRQIGEAHSGKTPAQVALNWLICKGTVPIPGAKNARQAQENAGALGWRLDEAEIDALDRISDAR